MAAVVAALALAGILLWLTPVLADFPVAALGGVLIAAVLPHPCGSAAADVSDPQRSLARGQRHLLGCARH
jgi:hypothetical protein